MRQLLALAACSSLFLAACSSNQASVTPPSEETPTADDGAAMEGSVDAGVEATAE